MGKKQTYIHQIHLNHPIYNKQSIKEILQNINLIKTYQPWYMINKDISPNPLKSSEPHQNTYERNPTKYNYDWQPANFGRQTAHRCSSNPLKSSKPNQTKYRRNSTKHNYEWKPTNFSCWTVNRRSPNPLNHAHYTKLHITETPQNITMNERLPTSVENSKHIFIKSNRIIQNTPNHVSNKLHKT